MFIPVSTIAGQTGYRRTVYGSTLVDDVRAVAKDLGIEVQLDPEPAARNSFIRSDRFSFYAVSDYLNQPVDKAAAPCLRSQGRAPSGTPCRRTHKTGMEAGFFFRRYASKE